MSNINIGYTTLLSQHMGKIIKLDNGNCGQFFTRSPQIFKTIKFNPKDWINIKKDIEESGVKFVIHGSFLINFCKNPSSIYYAHNLILEDMKISSYLDTIGVIIHMGKNTDNISYQESFNNYIQNIKHILKITKNIPNSPMLILETGAGQGKEVATDITELGMLRKNLTLEEQSRVGFCIDTCHIFTAGYDLRNMDFVNSFEDYIEMSLGWSNVKVIHLNDSLSKFNQKVDRHEDISYGEITRTHKYTEAFKKFIKICNSKNIPLVLETPAKNTDYSKQINLVKNRILNI